MKEEWSGKEWDGIVSDGVVRDGMGWEGMESGDLPLVFEGTVDIVVGEVRYTSFSGMRRGQLLHSVKTLCREERKERERGNEKRLYGIQKGNWLPFGRAHTPRSSEGP